jgi:hypothetical protein
MKPGREAKARFRAVVPLMMMRGAVCKMLGYKEQNVISAAGFLQNSLEAGVNMTDKHFKSLCHVVFHQSNIYIQSFRQHNFVV